jgi:hypothetical protein
LKRKFKNSKCDKELIALFLFTSFSLKKSTFV